MSFDIDGVFQRQDATTFLTPVTARVAYPDSVRTSEGPVRYFARYLARDLARNPA